MAKQKSEGFELDSLIGYNLKRVYMIAQLDFREALGEGGLGARDFSVLSVVVEKPNINQSVVARMLGIKRSGLVAIVDQLAGQGFLERVPVPGDRRVQALKPTPEGIAVFNKSCAAVKKHEEETFAVLTEDDQETLLALLAKVRVQREKEI